MFGIGISVALVVNNLGGTSNLELLIMANSAIRHLGMYIQNLKYSVHAGNILYSLLPVDKLKVNVDRVICGSLMTSLEMAGVSLTLLKMEPGWDQYIGMLMQVVIYDNKQHTSTQVGVSAPLSVPPSP